jgi:hypothetical protein
MFNVSPRVGSGVSEVAIRCAVPLTLCASMLLATPLAGVAQTWTQRITSPHPSARLGSRLAYDSARREAVLFGGEVVDAAGGRSSTNETWIWNGTAWAQRFPARAPSPRADFGMAYDAARGEVVVFGGNTVW